MSPTSQRNNSTTTDPIKDAIAAVDSAPPGKNLLYWKAADIFDVGKETLLRRHQNKQGSIKNAHKKKMLLNPQQEKELVGYIQGLSDNGLAPTRSMIKKNRI
jgi:hypothetical protein